MSIKDVLLASFKGVTFTVKDAYDKNPHYSKETVRARIYSNLGKHFKKIGKNLYMTIDKDCLLIEGDGRDLSIIEDEAVDCIITDHPWECKANKGGNRNFASYDTFKYTVEDFKEKARVLKEGSLLCEIILAENENNYEYLFELKQMAKNAGFEYYAKVPWKKGTFVSNTGRKAKNTEDMMIFSKGKARPLRLDAKKTKQLGIETFMFGTNKMFPTEFDVQAVGRNEKICQSEKPVQLIEELLDYLTKENEIVLDQFAGSGVVGAACIKTKRKGILIEKARECIEKISNRLGLSPILQ